MKTRYKPFVATMFVMFAGQQLIAQNPTSESVRLSGATVGGQSASQGKTLDDVRELLRAKRKQTGPQARNEGSGLESGEGAAEGGMIGSGGGSMGGGLSGGISGGMGMGAPGGMMGSGGASMGMPGGISSGAEGGSSGMSGISGPSLEKQKLIQFIQQLRERLKSKKHKREDVEKLLRSVLADYFQLDMEERVSEFDKVKARIAEMESKLQNRLDRQKEIIELQALQILHKADGLDFVIPEGESGSGFGGMGMGMSGYPSMGPGMAGPGGTSGPGMSLPGGMTGPIGMGPGEGGGRDDIFGSGAGIPPGGTSGGEILAASPIPLFGYDIGYGATRYLRLDGTPAESKDPLSLYKFMNSNSPVITKSTKEKMKSICNAMIEFHHVFQHLPGAVNRHVNGQPPHSWRIALLPLLGHSDLYREYQFDEPWDSPTNSKLISKMPNIYSDDELTGQQMNSTFYVITGVETAFPLDRPTTIRDITDGTNTTIGIVKAKLDIPWTKPKDIESEEATQLLSAGDLVASIDGVVFTIPANPKSVLRDMISRYGGEVIHFNPQAEVGNEP
jgi:Protein of unknown function (DUF1559)